jgi:NAD-dependent SIR2 family protein deacetylase
MVSQPASLAVDAEAGSALPATAPEHALAGLAALTHLVARSRRLVVLTGAGCSTASGIPDYRDRDGAWKRPPPMTYQTFVGSPAARQRYWARALTGWRQFRQVAPNGAHRALARLERAGRVDCLITQNVDGLHQSAGSVRVIDLHGRIDAVDCLQCGRALAREQVQAQLEALNPDWAALQGLMAPDGDALLTDVDFKDFQLVDCSACGGVLKPAVVFFGECVPSNRVEGAFAAVERADALLVVGSSLMVYSGYRFVRSARERAVPVAIINLGRTRADAEVQIRIDAACEAVLERLELELR